VVAHPGAWMRLVSRVTAPLRASARLVGLPETFDRKPGFGGE
jgi:hypothetical protein